MLHRRSPGASPNRCAFHRSASISVRLQLDALEKTRDAAEAAYDRADKAPGGAFDKLVEGKDPLTDYSKEGAAEAFAPYRVDPEGLKKANKKLYDWFKANGELTPAPKP